MNNDCDWITTREARLLNKRKYLASLKTMTFSEIKIYFSDIIEDVKYDLELLEKKKTILPAQCDGVISNLDEAKTLVQRLCEMFDHKPYPVVITTGNSGRELVIKLYYAHEQLGKLQKLVMAFRPHCRASSKQAEKKRTPIFRNLELFTLHCNDIIQSMASLQEKPHVATSVHSILSLEKTEQQISRSQAFTGRDFAFIHGRRPHPWYLVLVNDDFVEEHNTPKQRLIEENRLIPTETDTRNV